MNLLIQKQILSLDPPFRGEAKLKMTKLLPLKVYPFARIKKCKDPENSFNPTALRQAKIVYNFGLSECNRVMNEKRRLALHILHRYE